VKAYSSGNRQKLGLVQALMHDPELLVLDEPTSALDPLVQQEFYRIVDEVRESGRTVFLSSHVLPEVERIADRVGIIRNGTLVAVESVASLKSRAVRRIEILFTDPLDADPFSGLTSVRSSHIHDHGRVAEVLVEGEIDEVLKTAARWRVTNLVSHESDLEEAFLTYYQDPGDDAP
jgi:ABC-2 type transport system ATP-binding protein